MQNFNFETRFLLRQDENQIKKIWLDNFLDDEENTVDYFLENVFKNKKGVGAFLKNELIGMVLFLNAKIISENKMYNSVYFYAVCTSEKYRKKGVMNSLFSFAKENLKKQGVDICFLVPENEGLFKMYEKQSFQNSIFYKKELVKRNGFNAKNTVLPKTDFCYNDYKEVKASDSKNYPLVIWGESEFNFIFNKNRNDVSFVFLENGFAVYEKKDDTVLVYEVCGSVSDVISYIFSVETDADAVMLRVSAKTQETAFGMTYSLSEKAEQLKPIYFGLPYG